MIVVGHQPNYLPYLGFFDKAGRCDRFVLVDNTQFVKRGPFGWIHRNKIRTPAGSSWLTVPVLTHGRYEQTILEAEIDNHAPWGRKHWRTILGQYRKAPFFAEHAEFFEAAYQKRWDRLVDLNLAFIDYLFRALRIEVPVFRASALGIAGKATGYVIDLCRKSGATVYISGKHGRDYLDIPAFAEAGIELRFQEYAHPEYDQGQPGSFVPYCSVIDLLFQHGPRSLEILQRGGALQRAT